MIDEQLIKIFKSFLQENNMEPEQDEIGSDDDPMDLEVDSNNNSSEEEQELQVKNRPLYGFVESVNGDKISHSNHQTI
jgi:hypothetical protein